MLITVLIILLGHNYNYGYNSVSGSMLLSMRIAVVISYRGISVHKVKVHIWAPFFSVAPFP